MAGTERIVRVACYRPSRPIRRRIPGCSAAVADRIGPVRVLQLCQTLMALTAALWTQCRSPASIQALMFVYGFAGSAFFSLVPVVTATFFGLQRASGNIALVFFGCVPGISGSSAVAGK